ncbi:ATP-dependent DNA helicase [Trichonephila clavipes]|nr:ATP-dependent DNA helicase [Trichonephila clavipes]
MSRKAAFEVLDVTVQDPRCNKRMGGITLVLADDFCQILPGIPCGTRADEISACIKSSYIWDDIKRFHLRTNMRSYLSADFSSRQFADNLLQLGNKSFTSLDPDSTVSLKILGELLILRKNFSNLCFQIYLTFFQAHVWLFPKSYSCPLKSNCKHKFQEIFNYMLLMPPDQQ